MGDQKGETRLDRLERNIESLFKGIYELKESQKLTDEQLRKTDLMLDRTVRKLDDIGRQLGDLGLVQGEVAEDLFYRNVASVFRKRNLGFEKIRQNLKSKGVGEYDIVAEDGEQVLVIEVKNKLEKRMVDQFVDVKIRRFKDAFPKYRGYRILGGIGALVVKDEVGRYAEKAGLFVLTQSSEGWATLLNRKDFKAKEFN